MSKPLGVGDVVRLKSGGPKMTIDFEGDRRVANCVRFKDNVDEVQYAQFAISALDLAEE